MKYIIILIGCLLLTACIYRGYRYEYKRCHSNPFSHLYRPTDTIPVIRNNIEVYGIIFRCKNCFVRDTFYLYKN